MKLYIFTEEELSIYIDKCCNAENHGKEMPKPPIENESGFGHVVDLADKIKEQNYGKCIRPNKDCDCEGDACVACMDLAEKIIKNVK